MKERPIIFSGPMIRSILQGRKTMTRRIVKPQPDFFECSSWCYSETGHSGAGWYVCETEYLEEGSFFYRCPYGKVGDRLWVRETWSHTGTGVWSISSAINALDGKVIYRAAEGHNDAKWWPSIHMPRWASRITLEITGIKVERLQDITEEEAKAEGVEPKPVKTLGWKRREILGELPDVSYRMAFADLWETLNGQGSWELNPWCWAVSLEMGSSKPNS